MRSLPQRLLDSFHEFGDRLADQTLEPGCCCGSSSVPKTRGLVVIAPEDMFNIARLAQQLDKFLTPVPDFILQEYDVEDLRDEVRDEERDLAETAALLDETTSTSRSEVRQTTIDSCEEYMEGKPPPLMEVLSMDSSENNDAVSLLCDNIDNGGSSSSESFSSDDDIKHKAVSTPETAFDADVVDPIIHATVSHEEIEEFPEDEKMELQRFHDHEEPAAELDSKVDLADSFIDCSSVPQLVFDETHETFLVSNMSNESPSCKEVDVKTVTDCESTEQSSESDEIKYSLADFKRHKILGEGQFGQVWLVSRAKDANQKPYALKVLSKITLITEDLVDTIIRERDIMLQVKGHPFIVELHSSFQDDKFVFLLEEFCQGGEVFSVMHDRGRLPMIQAKFYSFCVADALAFLHSRNIIFRDLKPENVMIDKVGYPKLIDFGYAKQITAGEKTYSFCGTPRYFSPEMIAGVGHGPGVDHWALGILIYEQLTAENPFCYEGMSEQLLFESIQQEDYDVTKVGDRDAVALIRGLLMKDPRKRLGEEGSSAILDHPWFREMDLVKLRAKQIDAPWLPKIKNAFDCSCFDDWEGLVDDKLDVDYPKLSRAEERRFQGF